MIKHILIATVILTPTLGNANPVKACIGVSNLARNIAIGRDAGITMHEMLEIIMDGSEDNTAVATVAANMAASIYTEGRVLPPETLATLAFRSCMEAATQ